MVVVNGPPCCRDALGCCWYAEAKRWSQSTLVCPAAASFGHDCAKVGRLTVKYGFKFATREKEDVAWRVDCGRSDGSGAESGHGAM